MAIDLSYARTTVGTLLLVDQCTITASQLGTQNWTLDETTLVLTPPDVSTVPIVYSGNCQITNSAAGSSVREDIGIETKLNSYKVRVPWNEGDSIIKGNFVAMTACQDSTLVGAVLCVEHVVRTSIMVWRELICELLESNRGS
jgi:hypothetical protein